MFRRVAALIAAASATAAYGLAAPDANADPLSDKQYLDMVHSMGVRGHDDTLLTYAHQFCNSTTVVLPARPDLYAQGVRPEQFYAINEAASRVYCQNKIATPPTK
jgi:Protein of unknown function (DUF732)